MSCSKNLVLWLHRATGVGLGQPPSPLVKLHLAHTEKLLLEKGLSPPHQSSALVSEAKRHGS